MKTNKLKSLGINLIKLQDRYALGKNKAQLFIGLFSFVNTLILMDFIKTEADLVFYFTLMILGFVISGIMLHSSGIAQAEAGIKAARNPGFIKLEKKVDKILLKLEETKK